ncbi:MAG TPA: hypothetical protein VJB12_02715 [Candidatus Nanoarchaeia archaeon]|nr:hypothetical protein [Candidatus Nanoarchaeia archaeon]
MKGALSRNLVFATVFLALASFAFAAQPTIIALQGKLTNSTTGATINSATIKVNISSPSGTTIWNETFAGGVSNGFFDLLLGTSAENPLNLTFNDDYNISVYAGSSITQIGGTYRFKSSIGQISPSNLSAGNFSAEGNFSFGSSLFIDKTNNRVGIGTAAPSTTLQVIGDITATSFYGDGTTLTGVQSEAAGFKRVNITDFLGVPNSSIIRTENISTFARTTNEFNQANFTLNLNLINDSISLWNISGSNIFPRFITQNLGIGTNAPTKKLSINGTLNALTIDPSAFDPTINTTSGRNITIASSDGSVIIQLG